MKQRLFIGIKIPDRIGSKIINNLSLSRNFKITRPENFHITVLFLGDTEESLIGKISESIETALKDIKPFDIEISEFGQFPPRGNPNILFVSGKRGSENLFKLADRIRSKLKELGFTDDKEFKYHATIARLKTRLNEQFVLPKLSNPSEFKVEGVILYKSDLTPQGPVYNQVNVFMLK
jgi:2'-5' RNA ligase